MLLKRIYCRVKRIFVKPLTPEQLLEKERKETYDFLISQGVETEYGFVTMIGKPIIRKAPGSRIILKEGVVLCSDTTWNEAGINHPVILATMASSASIVIENGGG